MRRAVKTMESFLTKTLNATKTDHLPIATPHVMAMIVLKLHAINQPAR